MIATLPNPLASTVGAVKPAAARPRPDLSVHQDFDRVLKDQGPVRSSSGSGSSAGGDADPSTVPSTAAATDRSRSQPQQAPGAVVAGEADSSAVVGWFVGPGVVPVDSPATPARRPVGAPPATSSTSSAASPGTSAPKAPVCVAVRAASEPAFPAAAAGSADPSDDPDEPATVQNTIGTSAALRSWLPDGGLPSAAPVPPSASMSPPSPVTAPNLPMLDAGPGLTNGPPATANLHSASNTAAAADLSELPTRLGEQVQWLVVGGGSEARLLLHPADLGAISIQVRVEDRGASVWFAAEHPAARAALEAALPQLRERFANEGVLLERTRVTSDGGTGFGDAHRPSDSSPSLNARAPGGDGPSDDDAPPEASVTSQARTIVHLGLIDRYA